MVQILRQLVTILLIQIVILKLKHLCLLERQLKGLYTLGLLMLLLVLLNLLFLILEQQSISCLRVCHYVIICSCLSFPKLMQLFLRLEQCKLLLRHLPQQPLLQSLLGMLDLKEVKFFLIHFELILIERPHHLRYV